MSGRTKEELDRIKGQQQNAKAKKKKTATNKKTGGNKALGLRLPSVFDEKKTFNTLKKEDQKTTLQNMRTRMEAAERKEAAEKKEKTEARKTTATRYNPLIKTPTRLTKDTSPEINNLAEATLRKGMQGMESALVGYSDRRNMKRAEDILTGEYNDRFVPGVRTGLRMKVDDPAQVAKAEAEAKKAGYEDLNSYEKAKAEELIFANDEFYQRKSALDADVDAQGYTGIKKYIPEVAEVIGSIVPTMAVGAASGGIGATAGLTGRAAWAFGQLMTGGEISNRVSGQEARQVYDALKQQNGNAMSREQMVDAIKKANTAGELVGLAEAGTEALFGGLPFIGKGIADEAAKKIGWELLSPATKASIAAWRNTTAGRMATMVAQRMGGALGEGLEESIMTLAQPAIENAVAGLETEVTMQDILRDFGMGVAVSLVLGVPVATAETASALSDVKSERDAKNEILSAVTERAEEFVATGQMKPEEAKAVVKETMDVMRGKGSLNISNMSRESKTENNTREVYTSVPEAKKALERQAKGKELGSEVSVAVVENGVPETWTARVAEQGIERMQLGTTTKEEQQAYIAKARKMETATNAAERTGYQLNVKDEIVQQVSALGKAFGKDIEFFKDRSAVHGYEQDGKIFVNSNSDQSPVAAVIAHEMTHLMENTSSYKTLQGMMQNFYKSSLEDKKAEIFENYKAAGVNLDDAQTDAEVMAMFVEEKLLTDYNTIRELTRTDRSVAQKIVDWINKVIQKITGTKEQRFLIEARDLWNRALQEEQGNKKAPVDGAEKRYSVGEEFRQDIKKVFDKEHFEESHLLIGETPVFLERFGFDVSKPLMMTSKHARNIMTEPDGVHDQYHGLSEKDLIYVLSEMNDPVMVISSVDKSGSEDGTLMMLSSRVDRENNPIGVYVIPDKKGYYNRLEIDTNLVKSIYGKRDTKGYISRAAFENRILYVNKNKSQQLQAIPGVQFPNNIPSVDFNKNIARYKDVVKGLHGQQRHSIGRSGDAAYLDAVNSGDMETAQHFVNEAAKKSGYAIKAWHGTPIKGFTVFDKDKIGSTTDDGLFGHGFYFTTNKLTADVYAKDDGQVMPVFLKVKKAWWANKRRTKEETANELGMSEDSFTYIVHGPKAKKGVKWMLVPSGSQVRQFSSHLKEHGYDSVIVQHGYHDYEIVILDSEQIKAADPVTYDDSGEIIPLSERFKEENDDIRWSIGSKDAAYMDAVRENDMATADRLVREAAKAAGYNSPKLYHGTDYFGFTKIQTKGLEDAFYWSPFFATNDDRVAETYSGETDRRQVKDRLSLDVENLSIDDVIAYAKENINKSTRVATPQDIEKLRKPLVDEVEKWITQLDAEYAGKDVQLEKQALMDEAKENLRRMVNAATEEDAENARSAFYDNSLNILFGRNDAIFEDNLYFNYPPVRFEDVQELFNEELLVYDVGHRLKSMKASQIRDQIRELNGAGIYSLYANTDKLYEIDAKGTTWNRIPAKFVGLYDDELTGAGVPDVNTRKVAEYAAENGYDGVVIRNLVDVGGETEYKAPSDVYIFFYPERQVKSADPVTYDDNGTIIPLSERFANENDDIRWSIGKEDVADKDLRDLIKSENRKMREVFFSRSAMDRDLLWDMIEDEERNIVATGSYRYKMVQDIIDFAYETGFRYINEEMEPENSLGKVSIYVPERYRGEMDTLGGIAEVNKQMFGSGILFTYKENKNALDDAYATLQAENKGLLPETTDPSEQVQSILDVFGRGARNSLRELDADEYNPFAERDNPYRTDIENAVHDAMDSITALAVKKLAEQSRNAGREDVSRWVAKKIREDARNYTVGSVVDIDGERGTVTERITKGRSISYTVELDTGERRENVKPEELNVGVTPTLRYDELPKNEQKAWHEPPEDWDISRDLGDVAPLPISMKEFREILYENGITVGLRKLNEWFKNHGYLRKVERIYLPTQKSLDEGLFEGEKYGALITEEGQRFFLDLFTHNVDDFADPEDTNNLVLPGNKQDKDSPLEERDYKEMIAEYEDEIGTTGEDYAWAQALTGKGVTYSKDYARNFDAAAKNNPNLRKHLQRLFARPLESAKADYANAVRSKLGEMHSKMKELGIKKDTIEASAVQWYGEGQYQDKFGGMHEYTIEMLKEEFPTKWKDIEAAATYFRHVYDEYLNEINAAREQIYPHPLEDARDQIASYEVRRDRAEDKIAELRGTISELETVLAAKKAEYASAAEEDKAVLQNAIRYNEDRLNKAKISLGDYIARRSKYGEKIRQIQADIDSGDILRNKRILPRKDYFHHFQEMTNSLGDVFRLSRNSTEIDPRLEGTSGYTEPRSKFSGITLHRNNGRYKADAIGGFIEYAQAGEYMIHIDPVISQFRSHIAGMANATKDSRNANKLIRWLVQWTNDLAGKTNPADRFVQDVIGREAVQFARRINSRAKANAVVGNLNSATAQIFNLPNLVAHVKDPKAYVEGFADLCRFVAREKSTRDIVKESGFLSERYLDDVIKSFDEKKIKIPEKVAAWTLTVGDRYSTALIWFTAHHEAVNKGMRNPIEYADDIARRCVAGRGIGEIPITQKSNITQIFAPFQIEVNNAWQLYKEKISGVKNAETKRGKMTSFSQFLAILIVNFMLNTVTDLLIHRRVAFDPIYVLFQCISDWMNEDEDEEKNWAEKFMELIGRESGEIISNMPYGSLVAYYAFNNQWARQNLFGDQDPTRFGVGNTSLEWVVGLVNSLATGEDVVDDALGFLTTFVMPFGGKQTERTLQGLVNTGVLPQVKWGWKEGLTLGRVDAPGSYTKDGEFQFPLHTAKTDFGQWVANVLFGKYATTEGQKYLGKDFENSTFLQNVFGFNKTKERKELSEKATKVLTDLVKGGADVFEVYDTIRGIQDAEDTYAKNNVLRNSALTQDEKAKIILGYMTQKDDVESTEKKINAVLGVGLTVDDYLDIRNIYTIINKDENLDSASDKAYQFVSELAAAGYSSDQIAGIYEGMSFWQSIPAKIDKFTEMTSAGLDSQTALKVQEAFAALEPLPGKTTVSALQKVEAIAKLELGAEQEILAMSQAMGKEQYAKYKAATSYGVDAQTWVDFQNALAAADAANSEESKRNGSYDKDEKKAALDSLDVSNDVKAALWQTLDTSIGREDKDTAWKAGRNPYSTKVGADIVDQYMEAKKEWTVKVPEASEDVSLDSMAAPLAGGGRITSGFGYRNTGIAGASTNHQAIDIAAPVGTDVGATIAGVVTRVSSSDGYGNSVEITSTDAEGNKIITKYSHLDNFGVAVGDTVAQGQKIGEVGNTGTSSGAHLDFKLGVNDQWVDPSQYLDLSAAGIVDGTDYVIREGTGGSAAVMANSYSGGGSSGGGSSVRSGGGYTSAGSRVATVSSGRSNSAGSSGSGSTGGNGTLSLPKVDRSASVAGRSVTSPTYGAKGLTLPKAGSRTPVSGQTSVATTQRTGRTGGSLWDPDILG